jgi:hypothetical protein
MKAGDYVRTKDYGIHKISNLEHYDYIDYIVCENQFNIIKIEKSNIIKSSPNIIDLIEDKDYVNGKRVIRNCLQDGGNIILFEDGTFAHNDEIKSIVTKEQFELMEYKLGE